MGARRWEIYVYSASKVPEPRRLPVGDTADYQSALRSGAARLVVRQGYSQAERGVIDRIEHLHFACGEGPSRGELESDEARLDPLLSDKLE